MIGTGLSVIILFLCLHYKFIDVDASEPDNNFDMLVFSQEWLVTICKDYIHNSNGRECVYPSKKMQWSVHGIWPRDAERQYYLKYCNNSWAFDPEQIKPIQDELEQMWANIYKGSDPYSLWKHEWTKHGTCATEIQSFNSQFKYFSRGIEWYQKYSVMDMLNPANIYPDDNKKYTADEFVAAVKAKIKKNPTVNCYLIDGLIYLEEIHICFDKQLNLIDCDIVIAPACDVNGIIFPVNA